MIKAELIYSLNTAKGNLIPSDFILRPLLCPKKDLDTKVVMKNNNVIGMLLEAEQENQIVYKKLQW